MIGCGLRGRERERRTSYRGRERSRRLVIHAGRPDLAYVNRTLLLHFIRVPFTTKSSHSRMAPGPAEAVWVFPRSSCYRYPTGGGTLDFLNILDIYQAGVTSQVAERWANTRRNSLPERSSHWSVSATRRPGEYYRRFPQTIPRNPSPSGIRHQPNLTPPQPRHLVIANTNTPKRTSPSNKRTTPNLTTLPEK